MTTPIIQFGTSRFLQAHADLFISDAMAEGQKTGPITVVQTSGAADRSGRLAAFDGRPIPIIVRGLESGRPVERTEYVTSIARGLSSVRDWEEIERIVVEEAEILISNTSDSGYALDPAETVGAAVPRSFPGKLTKLLAARWRAGAGPPTLFPCELVPDNGVVLGGLCRDIALRSGFDRGFLDWLDGCLFANSLVDRIVPEALQPAGAVAEPYALWAIQNRPGLEAPCRHKAIQVVDDLKVVERLKLFILNLGHTVLAERWLADRRPADETVREFLSEGGGRGYLDTIYQEEVLPVFAAAGMDEAPAYRESVMERFLNPFLRHRLADIADNHAFKKARRVGGFRRFAAEAAPSLRLDRLAAIENSGIGGQLRPAG
jgi:tagaturonate reductase